MNIKLNYRRELLKKNFGAIEEMKSSLLYKWVDICDTPDLTAKIHPMIQLFIQRISMMCCGFSIDKHNSETTDRVQFNVELDDLKDRQQEAFDKLEGAVSVRLEPFVEPFKQLNEIITYVNIAYSSDSPKDREMRKAASAFSREYKVRTLNFCKGNEKAFDNFAKQQEKAISTLSRDNNVRRIVASVLTSLTVIGLFVGVYQYRKTKGRQFLFWKKPIADDCRKSLRIEGAQSDNGATIRTPLLSSAAK